MTSCTIYINEGFTPNPNVITQISPRSHFRSLTLFWVLHTYLSSYHTINPRVFSCGRQLIILHDQTMKSFHTVSLPITCSHRITYWFPVNHKLYLLHISARGVKVRSRGYGEYEGFWWWDSMVLDGLFMVPPNVVSLKNPNGRAGIYLIQKSESCSSCSVVRWIVEDIIKKKSYLMLLGNINHIIRLTFPFSCLHRGSTPWDFLATFL